MKSIKNTGFSNYTAYSCSDRLIRERETLGFCTNWEELLSRSAPLALIYIYALNILPQYSENTEYCLYLGVRGRLRQEAGLRALSIKEIQTIL